MVRDVHGRRRGAIIVFTWHGNCDDIITWLALHLLNQLLSMAKAVNTYLSHFANRVSNFRQARGWTQERLAHEMGISRNYICMIEGGRVPKQSIIKLFESLENAPVYPGSARSGGAAGHPVRDARQAAGLTIKELAQATHYKIGLLQAIEDGRERVTEQMAAALLRALPALDHEELLSQRAADPPLSGSASPQRGRTQTSAPRELAARSVPLLTWAQAAELANAADLDPHEGHLAFDGQDERAFAVTITGDSMEPPFAPGDVAIVYPGRIAANGNLVLGKTRDGEVFFKRLTVLRAGEFRFSSYNPVYPPFDRGAGELAWLYPVAGVHKVTL
jgi:transcriptional regulator with XRE-family HTH domain